MQIPIQGQKQTLAILQQKVCFTPETDIPYTRLVAIERERRELKEGIAALAAQLKRDER